MSQPLENAGGTTDPGLTDGGTGTEFSDGGSSVENPAPSSTETTTEAMNPAWNPLLEAIPLPEFREKATPILRQWDQNYSKMQREYKEYQDRVQPYEQYLGVDPGAIQYALGLLQKVNSDPKSVYEALADHLREQGIEIGGQTQENAAPNGNQEGEDLSQDPRYAELERRQKEFETQQAQFSEYVANQDLQRQQNEYESLLNSQLEQIKSRFPGQVDEQDLLQRVLGQIDRGEEPSALKAFEDQRSTFQRMYAAVNQGSSRPAPGVLHATGGIPAQATTTKDPSDMNFDERAAYFKQLWDNANKG